VIAQNSGGPLAGTAANESSATQALRSTSMVPPLAVPDLAPYVDALTAALAYADAGFYVGPLVRGSKNPGSVLGTGWHHLTSREPEQLAAWFAGADLGLFLHVGRSGAVVLDVDRPDALPKVLREAFAAAAPPFQSTRPDEPGRGHYVFAQPPGRRLGNGTGQLGKAFGEVRGANGVVVAAPSEDRYAWHTTGPVPVLPETVAALLPNAEEATDAASDAEVERFLREHIGTTRPELLEAVLRRFAQAAASGSRHEAAVAATCWAAREARAGLYPARAAADQLREAFAALMVAGGAGARSLSPRAAESEFAGILAWAVAQAQAADPAQVRADVAGRTERPTSGHSLGMAPPALVNAHDAAEAPDLLAVLWERESLAHVRAFAQARLTSPLAVLAVVLARVIATVPPHIVLPALVGSHASLNLFAALVGPSGGGKGAAEGAAADAVDLGVVFTASVGSGEGLGHLFAHREKGALIRDRTTALLTVPEVDGLTALGSRQGATLMPQLRQAWSGEALGFAYADPAKRITLERHSYRLSMVVGVQPGRAAPLLDDADGGTPQRFLWMPTTDPDAPDDPPPAPEPRRLAGQLWEAEHRGLRPLVVPDAAVDAIRGARLARLRGEGDALDGHALLCRLKVAAALTLLDVRRGITDEDWRLAGVVMAISADTRAGVVRHLAERASAANLARGQAEGVRAAVAGEAAVAHAVRRVAPLLLRHLQRHGEQSRSELRKRLPARDRAAFDDALEHLQASGQVDAVESDHGQRLRLPGGAA